MDPEDTLPALLDERSVMSCVDLGVTVDGGPMEGVPVLEPLEHSVLEIALDVELIEDLSVLEPLEHSVLEVARYGRPMTGISVLEPLEHSVPDVTLVWGDCSLIRMTVSDPLEHSGWDGYLEGRVVLCCSIISYAGASGYGFLRSFGGLGRTCIIDLNAGESTAPVGFSKTAVSAWWRGGVAVDLGHPDER